MEYVLGIDLGTSGVKALLASAQGNIVDSASASYTPDFLGNGFVEQDPCIWWKAVYGVIKNIIDKNECARGKVVALSCSGQMHSSVFLDGERNIIRKAILWNDTRTSKQARHIYEVVGKEKLLDLVSNLALEGFTLPKVLWLRDNESKNYEKLSKVIMPKDYINFMLTDIVSTDVSDAAGTLMYDVKNSCWCREILDMLNISEDILPDVIASTAVVGYAKKEICEELGLCKECKVVAGGADNSCAGIGNGAIKKGQAVVSIGTSGTVVAYIDEVNTKADGTVHLFNYSAPNSWYAMGCMLCAGEAMNWAQRTFFENNSFAQLDEFAEKSPIGSNALIFLPYLFGERTPHNDPNARGMFFGLNSSTSKGDILRAVMEGVGFGIKDLYTNVEGFTDINEVYITGGGAKSKLWGQIIADILNVELKVLNVSEGPSFGAMLIAMVGGGLSPSLEVAGEKAVSVKNVIEPSENAKKYDKYYDLFKKLYCANKALFAELNS